MRDSGTFSYAAHAAVVAVDPDLGAVEILDSVIVEDGGTLVNPRVVDGQIHGGLAQGIGAALFEEMRFDARVQPLASDVGRRPPARRGRRADGAHRPHEDALAPPAALANAVDDALAPLGVELLHSSITPRRIVEAVRAAGTPAATARGAA